MKQILVYSDSLSWGIIPATRNRFRFDHRWPGVMESKLNNTGMRVRVIEMHSPLELVILMLGTNDFQSMHSNNAWHSSQGIKAIITAIRQSPIEPGMPVPKLLLVAPPPIQAPKGPLAPKFVDGDTKCQNLASAYELVSQEMGCCFFDSSKVTSSSSVDGIHLDEQQHRLLGVALANTIIDIMTRNS